MSRIDFTKSIEACAAHYGDEADAVRRYMYAGLERAEEPVTKKCVKCQVDADCANVLVFQFMTGTQKLCSERSLFHGTLGEMKQTSNIPW